MRPTLACPGDIPKLAQRSLHLHRVRGERAWYDTNVTMFHVVLLRSGLEYDPSKPLEEQSGWEEHAAFMDGLVEDGFIVLGGPLFDEHRVVHAIEAAFEDDLRAMLARDPWSGTHLVVDAIEPWTIRLDGRAT